MAQQPDELRPRRISKAAAAFFDALVNNPFVCIVVEDNVVKVYASDRKVDEATLAEVREAIEGLSAS